jgi:hypothetical protein
MSVHGMEWLNWLRTYASVRLFAAIVTRNFVLRLCDVVLTMGTEALKHDVSASFDGCRCTVRAYCSPLLLIPARVASRGNCGAHRLVTNLICRANHARDVPFARRSQANRLGPCSSVYCLVRSTRREQPLSFQPEMHEMRARPPLYRKPRVHCYPGEGFVWPDSRTN